MANKHDEFFHDQWLGHVQTESDGLVVAKPVLLDANCAQAQPPSVQEALLELCPQTEDGKPRRIENLTRFFEKLFALDASLFDTSGELPEDVALYAPEGPQTIRPTYGLLHQHDVGEAEGVGTPASSEAAKYIALLWDVTRAEDGTCLDNAIGMSLDKPETVTGDWSYPPAAKFDRLLRHCRVPVGIITNREVVRLVYAPHGESSGHITFRIDDMATVGGRPILDAMVMLLNANQWFGVSDENSLPSLLRRSREHQGSVTEDLAEQVFSGLETLLLGFQQAAERDGSDLLRQALERDEDHLYRGLLTVMLRLVFILYAEDRSLLPVDQPLYAKRMSLLGLFERLQRDYGNYPDSMNNRFGAWGHIVSLCRVIYFGADHGDFHIPPRHGDLFDPHRFKFLEGWEGDSAPVITQRARAAVQVPTVDDGTVFRLLHSLLIFQGQRLSYRTLDVEQIGSVYEALMGYHVRACKSQAVAIKISTKKGAPKYWLEPLAVQAVLPSQRVKFLKNDCGFDKSMATKVKKVVDEYEKTGSEHRGSLIEALLPLAASKKNKTIRRLAQRGQYILQPGVERRRSGSHYTPRSLTSPIVQKTLEPLFRSLGEEPKADQVLELKVCDPAMGSGAFLVECCRQLADAVVAAWGREGKVEEITAFCSQGDVVAHARRLVAQRCLYGVDKNVMAMQLAKLSLWLFTLARELPFTFLDHSLRYGDSLVGLNFEQIQAFHWKPEKQLSFLEEEINQALGEVVSIRREIHALANDDTPEGQRLKAQRLFDANDATDKVRKIADVCVGAYFTKDKNKARIEERHQREGVIRAWLVGDSYSERQVNCWAKEIRDYYAPFHWWLEFPEVFYNERLASGGGAAVDRIAHFDGILGNPPFISGLNISGVLGNQYVSWQKEQLSLLNAKMDVSGMFMRRAALLLGENGLFGMIATNSIAEGATRDGSLKVLIDKGWKIYSATTNLRWPGEGAAVVVSVVHAASGRYKDVLPEVTLNNKQVYVIDSYLDPRIERNEPKKLKALKGLSSQGVIIQGDGFYLEPSEAENLISENIGYKPYILPCIGGDEVNNNFRQEIDKYIINFGTAPIETAQKYSVIFDIVRNKVKPERDKLRDDQASARAAKLRWWQFWAPREKFYQTLNEIPRCIVTARAASKHMIFSFQPSDRVFTDLLHVFAFSNYGSLAILQSRVHEVWARHRSSCLGVALRYSLTKAFNTFPFPDKDPFNVSIVVEAAGKLLYEGRADLMETRMMGLTPLYNLLKNFECEDECVLKLRQLHEDVDRAVLDSYGWTDIDVPPYHPACPEEEAALEAFNNEVLDRLYSLNFERAAEEERAGLAKTQRKNQEFKKDINKKQSESKSTIGLFFGDINSLR